MNQSNISPLTRILFILCGIALVIVLFTPIWRIDLSAPQYPEGLRLQIFANKIAGDVDIINGLNHYIGMKTLHTKDFIEFTLLPFIIGFFAVLFILAALLAKRKWLYSVFILFVLFGILAMVDFWRWEYNYGHNLDPNAAIIVPGMAYQPPLIGFKQLLNFGAYSVPDIGGWIFVGVGVVLLFLVIREWRIAKKNLTLVHAKTVISSLMFITFSSGCSSLPQPLQLGKDQCYSCKMTISDQRFGAEVVTTKFKIYKFDDTHCLLEFNRSGVVQPKEIKAIYLTNFNTPYQLMAAEKSLLLKSDQLRSPMNGNVAAFENEEDLKKAQQTFPGKVVSWKELNQ
jgi:copper chaperone NosL